MKSLFIPIRALSVAALLLVGVSVHAQPAPPPPPPPAPQAPPPPPVLQSGQVMEPGVTIIQTRDETIYEYRAGAVLYLVRVVPKSGAPYYYFDQDGDGELDYSPDDPRVSKVNQWVLFRW